MASGFCFLFGVGGFLVVFVLLVFFSPSSCCVSFPFNDDLGTPPTRRPHSWDGRRDWSKGAWPVGLLRCAETEQGYEDFNQAHDLQRLSLSKLVHGVQLELAP